MTRTGRAGRCALSGAQRKSLMPVMVARNCKRSRTFVESLSDGCMVAAEVICPTDPAMAYDRDRGRRGLSRRELL